MEELTEKECKAVVDALIKSGDIKVVKHKNSIEVQDNDYNTLAEISPQNTTNRITTSL